MVAPIPLCDMDLTEVSVPSLVCTHWSQRLPWLCQAHLLPWYDPTFSRMSPTFVSALGS